MILSKKALIIEKISKAYDFEGRQGVSRKVRVLIETDIFRLNATEELLNQLENGKEFQIEFAVRTVKEDPIFELLSVDKSK